MSRIAAASVAVRHPETMESFWFHSGDEVPDWACEVITNEAVFAQSDEEAEELQAAAAAGDQVIPAVEWDTPNYDGMNNAELKALLEERELPTGGNHSTLVARLEAADGVHG